jgi:hypothetical protein
MAALPAQVRAAQAVPSLAATLAGHRRGVHQQQYVTVYAWC